MIRYHHHDLKRTPRSVVETISPVVYICVGSLLGILATITVLYSLHLYNPYSITTEKRHISAQLNEVTIEHPTTDTINSLPKPIPPMKSRGYIPILLELEGLKTGVEIGVDRGHFSQWILQNWKQCEEYTLVDLWQHQVCLLDSLRFPLYIEL